MKTRVSNQSRRLLALLYRHCDSLDAVTAILRGLMRLLPGSRMTLKVCLERHLIATKWIHWAVKNRTDGITFYSPTVACVRSVCGENFPNPQEGSHVSLHEYPGGTVQQ
jgi:hypothetical protein